MTGHMSVAYENNVKNLSVLHKRRIEPYIAYKLKISLKQKKSEIDGIISNDLTKLNSQYAESLKHKTINSSDYYKGRIQYLIQDMLPKLQKELDMIKLTLKSNNVNSVDNSW